VSVSYVNTVFETCKKREGKRAQQHLRE